jgi:HAD superfamily hydrolase (TIGR01509 family)
MPLSAILWDNDGVLVDTEVVYFEATRAVLAAAGYELSEGDFVEMSLRRGRSAFELVGDRFAPAAIEAMRLQRNRDYHEAVARGVRVNPGVRECLQALCAHMRMGIVTGSRRDHFEAMHRTSGLMPYFEFTLTHDEYERSKPHPEPYLTAVERYDLDPGSCVVIEDSERGVRSAVAAGLRCIAVPNALTRDGDFSEATLVLADVGALPEILRRLDG